VGWYRIESTDALHVGSIVLARLPSAPAAFAARRGYLPMHIPLLKRIGAVAPQVVCVRDGIVRIDSIPVAVTLFVDGSGRRLTAWPQCRRLRAGEVFLLSTTNPASFDSRYFGPVNASAVIGQARPLWTRQ
jgi:conjugative transfer signal peptidase TraF